MESLRESNPSRSSDGAHSLAREYYCDPSLFAEEYAKIFHSAWWMLGRSTDWLKALTYRALLVAGQPIVVIRRDPTTLVAHHNVCRHRGAALLADGTGCLAQAALTCPYHAWTYHLEGALAGAPNMALVSTRPLCFSKAQ